MASIFSRIGRDPYLIKIKSPSGNTVIADEPVDKGGKDRGFSPKELLASALAACTSATLMMYAERNQLDLREVKIHIDLEGANENGQTQINRILEFIGDLDDKQRMKLLRVANACPVHKILTGEVNIDSSVGFI